MFLANNIQTSIAVCVTALMLGSGTVSANDATALTEQSLIAQGAQVVHHRLTGKTNFIGSSTGKTIALPGTGTAQSASAAAMDALNAYGTMFGLSNPAKELSQKSIKTTNNGRSVVRYQQNYNGIPVIGGELIVNLSQNNGLLSVNGEVSPKLAVPTTATITAQQASNTALAAVAKWHNTNTTTLIASAPLLSVYDPRLISPDTSPAKLVWRVEVSSKTLQPIRELILIDAQRGNISLHFNQIDTALNRATYNANNSSTLPGNLLCNEVMDPTCAGSGIADAVSAHLFASDTYSFYSTNHGRDGIDNAGGVITSSVNYYAFGECPNAYWDGTQMVYCAGLVVDDVVAHELTHGVTENTSNLFYYYQSGAINESLSDVWGEFVDLSNSSGSDTATDRWLMGEDLNVSGMVGAIRSMKDPTVYGDPDKMSSVNYWKDADDNGGVHTNSGINNKAVYLMVDGDTFNGRTITGIGITKVAKIYYDVQTNMLTTASDYFDLYNALNQSCQNLIGTAGITSSDCTQVKNATKAVEMDRQPGAKFNPDASVCPGGFAPVANTFLDDIEAGLGNWTLSIASGSTNWVNWNTVYGPTYGTYATSGTESLFGESPTTASDLRASISLTVPTQNPFLHFRHAFDFEYDPGGFYDGGVLEYSTDSGVSWSDAGGLIAAGQSYNATLFSAFGNPLGGRRAFSGSSHGYVSSLVDLNGMRGKTVQFRWRVGSDNGIQYLGWFLDDVGVYTCLTSAKSDSSSGFGALGWPFLLLGLLLLPLRRRFKLTT